MDTLVLHFKVHHTQQASLDLLLVQCLFDARLSLTHTPATRLSTSRSFVLSQRLEQEEGEQRKVALLEEREIWKRTRLGEPYREEFVSILVQALPP